MCSRFQGLLRALNFSIEDIENKYGSGPVRINLAGFLRADMRSIAKNEIDRYTGEGVK